MKNLKPEQVNAVGVAITGVVGAVVSFAPHLAPIATTALAIASFLFGWASPQPRGKGE